MILPASPPLPLFEQCIGVQPLMSPVVLQASNVSLKASRLALGVTIYYLCVPHSLFRNPKSFATTLNLLPCLPPVPRVKTVTSSPCARPFSLLMSCSKSSHPPKSLTSARPHTSSESHGMTNRYCVCVYGDHFQYLTSQIESGFTTVDGLGSFTRF